jgi:MFS family permease
MRERRRVLLVTAGALFLSVLVWFNYSAVLPLVVDEWGLSGTQAGIVFGAFQAGYLVAILPAGRAADRHSPRWTIAVGAVGVAVPSLAFAAVADGFALGAALRFLSGLFMAGVYVPGMRFVSDWFPEATRGRALGLYIGTFELGSGLSFVFATTAAEVVDWRLAVALTSAGALAVPVVVLGLTRDAPGRGLAQRQPRPVASARWRAGPFSVCCPSARSPVRSVGCPAGHQSYVDAATGTYPDRAWSFSRVCRGCPGRVDLRSHR